jgi:hypothetical protein
MGDGGSTVGTTCGHTGTADEVAGDRKRDGGVVFLQVTMDESDVGLGHLALGEHLAELAVGAVVFGDEDEAAGLLVESMDDAGAEIAAGGREFGEVEEQRVDEGAAVSFVVGATGAGVDHHAGRFIYDGEVLVFVEDVQRDVFGCGVERRGVRAAFDLDRFAAMKLLFGLGGVAVDANLIGLDKELNADARDVWKGLSEVLVEAEIGGGGVGEEGADCGGVGVFLDVVEFEDGDWWGERLFDAAGGAVLGFYGAATLALGEHIFRGHG